MEMKTALTSSSRDDDDDENNNNSNNNNRYFSNGCETRSLTLTLYGGLSKNSANLLIKKISALLVSTVSSEVVPLGTIAKIPRIFGKNLVQ
jgi:hypothetical protein